MEGRHAYSCHRATTSESIMIGSVSSALFRTFLATAIQVSSITVTTPGAIDLRPPARPGQVDSVALRLPAIDALPSIELLATPETDGKKYVFTNTANKRIML